MKRSHVLGQPRLLSHQVIPYPSQKKDNIKVIFHQLWNRLINYFTHPPEPKIRKKSNRQGKIWWEVYDPYTNAKGTFSSELEVRMWLDERYHQFYQ